jgi:hypothetical protein
MKRLGCFGIIIVLLLAVIAYDQWRISQLESKIASIATKVHASKGSKPAAQNSDLASALAQAQAYTQQAQDFLNSKNVVKAEEQLKKAKVKLESANSFSKNIYANSAEFLGKARVRTERVFKEAWKDISAEPKPKPKQKAAEQNSKN